MKRRDLLKTLPLGMAAAAVPFSFGGFAAHAYGKSPLLGALTNVLSADSDRVLVLINLEGGNDGLNTVIPFSDPLYTKNRDTIGFTANDLAKTKIRPELALNPNFGVNAQGQDLMMKLWKENKLAVVQNVGYANPNRSHFRATDIWNTATDSNVVLSTGWVGRYLESLDPQYPLDVKPGDDPLAIQIGFALSPVFQGSKSQMALAVTDPSDFNAASAYADDPAPNTPAGHELEFIRSILIQSDSYGDRFKSLFATKPTNKVPYTNGNTLAQQLKKVAWCVAAGMKTKIYFANLSGFDTHINQNSNARDAGHGLLMYWLADAISSFQADLEAFGVADRVIGMTYSEFGRRVEENGSKGTDHGTAGPQFLFGSQINGELYGNNPNLSDLDANGDLKWGIDYRQLYAAVLGDWFGVDESLRKAVLLDASGNGERFGFRFTVNGTSTEQSLIRTPASSVAPVRPANFVLEQNYPNPFNPTTAIRFTLAESTFTRLEVFDGRGSLVKTLVAERLGRGEHRAVFDASGLTSGVYYYRLEAGHSVQTKAMQLVK